MPWFLPALHDVPRASISLPVELRTVQVHIWSGPVNGSVFKSFLVTHLFQVLVCGPILLFIMASILARCSGVILARRSAGIGISPLAVTVSCTSQRPVFMFNGWILSAAQTAAAADTTTSPKTILDRI
jgi:hypothetical protein